jgi:SsrA-binding protein
MVKDTNNKTISSNKKAYHDYAISEKFTAGIVLSGTEIKSIRAGKINLKDSFARIDDGELWVHRMHISPYEMGNRYNHEPERKRKLLLNKQEIRKLIGKTKETGLTLVPLALFLSGGWAKLEIGIAKGKALHDKRESIAKKETQREIERIIKTKY